MIHTGKVLVFLLFLRFGVPCKRVLEKTDERDLTMSDQHARVRCLTSKGTFVMDFHRNWSPLGFDRAVELFEKGFYDHSHFFRVIPNFLVQFGISYRPDLQDQETIPDEPQLNPRIPFEMGTIAFAGSGENSRDTHLFIALDPSGDPQWGKEEPWETPVGRVVQGLETVVQHFYSYGDDKDLPEQGRIYDGPKYIEEEFPLTDKFEKCTVERYHGQYVEHSAQGHAAKQKKQPAAALPNLAPMDPTMTTLGCLFLVVLGVLTIKCWFAPRKIEDKRS